MQINLNTVDWKKLVLYFIIFLLSLLLIKECTRNSELESQTKTSKEEVKTLKVKVKQYSDKNNKLNEDLVILNSKKEKVRIKVTYLKSKEKSELKRVPNLTTKEIATYYQKRYKKPIVITQYGVSLSDSIAKENIKEVIQKDNCIEEVKLVREELVIEEKKSMIKDTINSNLVKSNNLLVVTTNIQEEVIKKAEKSVKVEKTKKTFWQITTGAILIASTYFIISN